MPNLVIALIVVFGGLWLIRKFAKMKPGQASGFAQKLAGGAIVAFSGLLALRGNVNAAIPLFVFGLGLLGKGALYPGGFGWPGAKSEGQKSRVATSVLVMELDHDSGTMDCEVLVGRFKGKHLSRLNDVDLQVLHGQCVQAGDQSQALFEAWLDRNKGEWREGWGRGASAAKSSAGPMSAEEARAILGVKPDASADDIRAAHRRLMKDFHPDKGGSDYLAAKINAAKDLLLNG